MTPTSSPYLEIGCKKWLWGAWWGCSVSAVPATPCEVLPGPWVSLFLLSRTLLSAGIDRDELQQPPQCFASRSYGT